MYKLEVLIFLAMTLYSQGQLQNQQAHLHQQDQYQQQQQAQHQQTHQQPQQVPEQQVQQQQQGQHPNQQVPQQQQQQQGNFVPQQQHDSLQVANAPANTFRKQANVHDREHIMEHYDGVIKDQQQLTEEEIQFHYFKAHDYDNNNKLDGIELISALTDYHKDQNNPHKAVPENDLGYLVDSILMEDDTDDDGYIDYVEFVQSQKYNPDMPQVTTQQPAA